MGRIVKHEFGFEDTLDLYKAALRRLCEITIEKLARDYPTGDALDDLSELYLRAHLSELYDRVRDACGIQPIACPAKTIESFNAQLKLIVKHNPELAPIFKVASHELKSDVSQRFESYKRRVSDEYARDVYETLDRHQITSPIEQIFLLEWKLQRIEEKFSVELIPQATVGSRIGSFILDFLVRSKSDDRKNVRVGIELDGHEFHEKTKEQATRDKRRDRAITNSGVTVLHFSGSEIVSQTSKCIREVIDFLKLD
ncbi:MAG: DUF559 domain-containing protein [Planctomycetia bacterium]|nr:DUF559 domain-containing protein [Planctomycetia bacterium]